MNKEDLAILKKYEDRMRTAVGYDYARAVQSRDLDLLLDIWNRHHDTPYRMNKGCSACQLTFLKMLGRWYFDKIKVVKESEPALSINELQDSATDTAQKDNNKSKKSRGK